MADPVEIYISGSKLEGWTTMELQRSKDELTGTLTVGVFFSFMPEEPVLVDAGRGREILVYIGGEIAFTGILDKRRGTGSNSEENGEEGGRSASIGPNEYTVSFTARGKTKYLIDSSHNIRENLLRTNSQQVTQKLIEPWGIELDWQAEAQDLDKVRFRDGARVFDELDRVMVENSHYMYETRDGRLRVTDGTGAVSGDSLILGQNILTFSAEQSEDKAKKKVKVKGQLINKDKWGEDAVLKGVIELEDDLLSSDIPVVVQHYGNGTPEALERRARYELNKRMAKSKNVTIEVFHVQAQGTPWDVGNLHYVEVPPEGIFDVLECTRLSYSVDAEGTLKTTLTLAPIPNSGSAGAAGAGPLANLPQETADELLMGEARKADAGVSYDNAYPAPWSMPQFSLKEVPLIGAVVNALSGALSSLANKSERPPERIP